MAAAPRSSTADVAAASTLAVTKPSGAIAGDLLVAGLSSNGGTVVPPAGWTQIGAAQDNGVIKVAYFSRTVGAGDGSTYSFTSAGSTGFGSVCGCYSGTDLQITASSVSRATSSTTFTTASITTQRANAVVVTMFNSQLSGVTFTPPSGETERQDANSLSLNDAVQVSAGSSGTKSSTTSGSTDAAYCILSIEEAAGQGLLLSDVRNSLLQVAA